MQTLQKATTRFRGAASAGEACILGTATAVPPFFWSQQELKEHLLGRSELDESRFRLATAAFDRAAVATRYAALPLPELGTSTPTISSLNYRRHATALGEEVSARAMDDAAISATAIDMIISVSCTGVMIPSMDAHLANVLGCRADVRRLPTTELGCVASLREERDSKSYRALAPRVDPVSAVGSGDVLLAGFLAARHAGRTHEESLRAAVAAGAASTLEVGAGRFDARQDGRLQAGVELAALEPVQA